MSLVETDWLEKNLSTVKIVDCSWHMPQTKRNGFEEYKSLHIPHSIFFDIDKFKFVNDTYGHLYGDYVLEEVSRIISKNVRSIDIVGRYGGEEFSVLLVNTDINECKPLAEKIVKKIAKKTYLKDGVAVNLTISAGMSGFPLHSDNLQNLIDKADKAMYSTKRNGGNGVTIAE